MTHTTDNPANDTAGKSAALNDAKRRRRAHRENRPTYKTEIECARGHVTRRYVSTDKCVTCARAANAAPGSGDAGTAPPDACECCGTPTTQLHFPLVIDFDYTTKRLRGWVCRRCKQGIGCFGGIVEQVERALAYLAIRS